MTCLSHKASKRQSRLTAEPMDRTLPKCEGSSTHCGSLGPPEKIYCSSGLSSPGQPQIRGCLMRSSHRHFQVLESDTTSIRGQDSLCGRGQRGANRGEGYRTSQHALELHGLGSHAGSTCTPCATLGEKATSLGVVFLLVNPRGPHVSFPH